MQPEPFRVATGDEAGVGEGELAPPFLNAMAGSGRDGPFDIYRREAEAPASEAVEHEFPSTALPQSGAAGRRTLFPHGDGAELLTNIASQLAEMRGLLERISMQRVDERVDRGPRALQEARSRLIDQGVGPSVLIPVLDDVADATVSEATRQMVLQTLERKLAGKLPPVVTPDLTGSPRAMFVVGPGGAGKTTVALRLGVQLANERGARVTLAGIDVGRAGAPQQLTALGAATGLPVRLCYSPGELKALLAEGSADVVIIDTPGNNGARRDRMTELSAFTQVAGDRATLLTVPATTNGDDIVRTTSAFAEAGLDGLVLTRCDEARTFGALLTAACESRIGVAYSAHGDGISEPLHGGDNHALALAIVGGRWPQRADVMRAPALAVQG